MIRPIYCILIQSACFLAALASGPVFAAEPPNVGVIDWLEIDAYCAFLPADEAAPYGEDGGWRYVYMTDMSKDARGFMMIDGEVRELMLDRKFYRDDFEMRHYVVEGEPYEVRVFMVPDDEGYENTGYTGAIYVSDGKSAAAVAYYGDCSG